VQTTAASVPANEITQTQEGRFLAVQMDALMSQTMLRRVQRRMQKTDEEVRNNLVDLKVEPMRDSSIIVISVDSPSADFAKKFADTLAEEYLKLRDEQRVTTSEEALRPLMDEVKHLSEEFKTIEGKLKTFYEEHDATKNPELQELKALYEVREQARSHYNDAVGRLTAAGAARRPDAWFVSILEPAIVEPKPVYPRY